MQPKTLIVGTYHPEALGELYGQEPFLAELPFEEQRTRLFSAALGDVGDAYVAGLRALGCEAQQVICNADALQARWATEHRLELVENTHDRRRQIIAAQVDDLRTDILLVFEWSPLGDAFLAEVKPRVRLIVGQIASALPDTRTFAAYDLMISSWPPIVDYFRREGIHSEPFKLGFDARILGRLPSRAPAHDVTFVGGFAPCHRNRIPWLERLLEEIDVEVFGYGTDSIPAGSPIRVHHRGAAWTRRMFETLQRSRITLHLQPMIDVRGSASNRFATAMRLYEATGVGTCLITEQKQNLAEIFEPDRELIAYHDEDECVQKIRYYLTHDKERKAIAEAGQRRTLRDHTYAVRMKELLEILRRRL